jgi:hypothetical protein
LVVNHELPGWLEHGSGRGFELPAVTVADFRQLRPSLALAWGYICDQDTPLLSMSELEMAGHDAYMSKGKPVDPLFWNKFWASYDQGILPICSLDQHIDNIKRKHYPEVWAWEQAQKASAAVVGNTTPSKDPAQVRNLLLTCCMAQSREHGHDNMHG